MYFLLTAALLSSESHAFVLASSRHRIVKRSSTSSATDYDTVKVDLSDGRDYPIYIGAGFSDQEGESLMRYRILLHNCRVRVSRLLPIYF